MSRRGPGEHLRGLILTALAGADRPLPTRGIRLALAATWDLHVLSETLYRSLAILESRGDVVKVGMQGRDVTWALDHDRTSTHVLREPAVACSPATPGIQPTNDCIKVLRADGTLLHMNRPGCVALGIPEDETEFGMPWLDLLPADFRRQGLRALNTAANGNRARFAGASHAAGALRHWDNVLTPIAEDDGRIREILCLSRDVTGEVAAYAAPRMEPGLSPAPHRLSANGDRPVVVGKVLANRINVLFAAVQAPGQGRPYRAAEVLRALEAKGIALSAAYLSQLRRGTRLHPSADIVVALAEFFGVRPSYFYADYRGNELTYIDQLTSDLAWLQLAHNAEVRRLTCAVLELSTRGQRELLDDLELRTP